MSRPSPLAVRSRWWLVALVAGASMLATASLGRWQLSRAAEKEAMQAMLVSRAVLPAVDVDMLVAAVNAGNVQSLVYRTVVLDGRWIPGFTVYLDNRQMQGHPGFFVLTPLQLRGRSEVVLVQRGWVPRNFQQRTQLPPMQTAVGNVRVEGRVALAPSQLFELGRGDSAQGFSRIRQNLVVSAFRAETGLPVMDLSVLQTGEAGDGLKRDWPVVASGVEKHYGYAFQWFGLCGLIALLYVWFQIVPRLTRRRWQPPPSSGQ